MKMWMSGPLMSVVALAAACGGKARKPELYRDDTQQLLATREAQLRSCYDQALAADAAVAGTVRVTFVVAKKSGAISQAKIDPAGTTAPEPLQRCVLDALAGLSLQPADRNEGRATFQYAFQPPASS